MTEEDTLGHTTQKQVRIAVATFFFISGFTFSTWASRIPTIQQHLHLNEAQLGSVLFAMPVGMMLTMPLTGFLLTRYSSKSIMLIGALVSIANLCLVGLQMSGNLRPCYFFLALQVTSCLFQSMHKLLKFRQSIKDPL